MHASCLSNAGGTKEELDMRDGLRRTDEGGKRLNATWVPDDGTGILVDHGKYTTLLNELGDAIDIGAVALTVLRRSTKLPGTLDPRIGFLTILNGLGLSPATTLPVSAGKELRELGASLKLIVLDVALVVGRSDLLLLKDEVRGSESDMNLIGSKRRIVESEAPVLPLLLHSEPSNRRMTNAPENNYDRQKTLPQEKISARGAVRVFQENSKLSFRRN